MRMTWLASLMGMALVVSACGSGDTPELEQCGAGSICPRGFECNPVDNLCYRSGTIPDARPSDAATVAPDTMITMMPPALGNMATVTFAFTSDRAGATFECRVGTAAFAACTTPHMIAPGDGTHTFQVRAVAGGLSDLTPASHMFTIDTMPPVVTITAGPSGTVTETTATFAFTSTEANSTFMCSLDGGAAETCTSGKTYSGLSTATHTFTVTARDPAGNTSAPAMRVWNLQAQPAIDTTITSAPPAITASSMAMFSFTSNRSGATFECSLDGASFAACVPGVTFSDLLPGAHTFSVRARAGSEVDATPDTHSWTIDRTGLVAMILSGAEGGVSAATVTFTYMASDPLATFECGLDGTFVSCDASGRTFTGLVHATAHIFSVRAVKDGVTGEPASRPFVVDALGPVIMIAAPADGTTVGGNPTITFTVDDAAAQYTCLIDGQALAECVSGMSVPLDSGDYTLTINGIDAVGNTGTASVDFTVEVVGPTAAILDPADGEVVGISGEILFSVGDGAASVVCMLDGGPVDCAAPSYSFFLSGGDHTFTVQAFDASGNPGNLASVAFEVDADAPVVTQISHLTAGTSGAERFAVTISDRSLITTVQCRVDGGSFFQCGADAQITVTLDELGPGEHLLEVYAVDRFGNTGLTSMSRLPPATFARITFTHVIGAGHLVAIGNDYADRCSTLRAEAKRPQVVEQCGIEQVLVNAVDLAPATEFDRGVRVAAYVGNADTSVGGERDNVRAIIDEAFFDDAGDFTWYDELDDPAGLRAMLSTVDVFVILDQNDADIKDFFDIASDWEDPLRDFLESGGVVIVMNGLYEGIEGDEPSVTHYLLHDGLLAISSAEEASTTQRVPCNTEDTLRAVVEDDCSGDFCFRNFEMVGFATAEPWTTYAAFGDFERLVPTVMHKWFGTTDEGPVGAGIPGLDGGSEGIPVFFHDEANALIDDCETIGNGTAVYHSYAAPGSTDFPAIHSVTMAPQQGLADLMTVMGVEPLDWLHFSDPLFPALVSPNITTVDVDVTLPTLTAAQEEAFEIRIDTGCGTLDGAYVATNTDVYTVTGVCETATDVFNLTVEALGRSGEILGYSLVSGVSIAATAVTMPAYEANSVTLGTTGFTDIREVTMQVASIAGFGWFYQGQDQGRNAVWHDDSSAPYQFTFYSDAGDGAPPFFTQMFHGEEIRFDTDPCSELDATTGRQVVGPRPASLSFDLGAALLPRQPMPDVDGLAVDTNIPAEATFDGGYVVLRGDNGVSWAIAFGTREFVAPGPPAGSEDLWPDSEGEHDVSAVEVTDGSWLDGYDGYRNLFLFGSDLNPTTMFPFEDYTWRWSRLRPGFCD